MAKALFLKYFQENLCFSIKELINEKWQYKGLTVTTEKADIAGAFSGFIDICITDEENESALVAIEIEHLADYNGALRNIEKMKTWAHNSNYRQCAFLHILNEDCNLSPDQISQLVKYAKQNERKGLGFYYDFVYYKVEDNRTNKATAQSIVDSRDFQTRIWMLMEQVGVV